MYVIDLDFESVADTPISELFGAIGVYVLWAPNATTRPTYIGEGDLLDRLSKHDNWLTRGITGAVARTDKDATFQKAKRDAQIAEAFMLQTAEFINLRPTKNLTPGNLKRLRSVFRNHGALRLNIRGCHPFRRPGTQGWRLDERAECQLQFEGQGDDAEPVWYLPWYRRTR